MFLACKSETQRINCGSLLGLSRGGVVKSGVRACFSERGVGEVPVAAWRKRKPAARTDMIDIYLTSLIHSMPTRRSYVMNVAYNDTGTLGKHARE